ncbi:unnamed protein product [Camellia sinensis]
MCGTGSGWQWLWVGLGRRVPCRDGELSDAAGVADDAMRSSRRRRSRNFGCLFVKKSTGPVLESSTSTGIVTRVPAKKLFSLPDDSSGTDTELEQAPRLGNLWSPSQLRSTAKHQERVCKVRIKTHQDMPHGVTLGIEGPKRYLVAEYTIKQPTQTTKK